MASKCMGCRIAGRVRLDHNCVIETAEKDRKSTRLNSSHLGISYAVFCLKAPATTEIYTLSLHDALPICKLHWAQRRGESNCIPPKVLCFDGVAVRSRVK